MNCLLVKKDLAPRNQLVGHWFRL